MKLIEPSWDIEIRNTEYKDYVIVECATYKKYQEIYKWCEGHIERDKYMGTGKYIITSPLIANLIKLKFDVQ